MAQQDPMYTQYIHNLLAVNPAYAGSRDAMTFVLLHRNQWVGIEGAPKTENLTLHSPLKNQNLGLGISLVNDRIGPTKQTGVYADFAGRIRVSERGRLAFGIKAGFNHLRTDLVNLTTQTSGDPAFSQNVDRFMPNIGVGVYYDLPNFYVGFSIPKIIENAHHDYEIIGQEQAKEHRHYFLMLGSLHSLSRDVKIKPTFMMRLVENAPLSAEVTVNMIFEDRFWLGGFYRLEDAMGLMVAFNITPQFRFGYSYDYTLTDLSGYTKGSHEVMIIYDFTYRDKRIVSPRYF
jgi:type IX secretion system PorP/SprF family membrane protein